MNIAYIVSRYPAVSHSFVQREILALRELGWSITTISVRRPLPVELLTDSDKAEARATHVLVAAKPFRLIAAIAFPLFFNPGGFLRAYRTAVRLRRPGWHGFLWSLFYFVEALIVHHIARRNSIRHVHAHFANVASDVAMIAAVLGTRGIHDPASFSFTMHGPTEFFDVVEHRLVEKARAARFIICISDFARSQMMTLLPPEQWCKLHVVHCGVDPRQFEQPRGTLRVFSQRSGPGSSAHRATLSPRHLLTVGRLVPMKGHPVLFKALEEILLRGHDIRLTLIGDGPLRPNLEKLTHLMGIQDRVVFLGNVGQDLIHQHYSSADLFVLPSFAEGIPVVLMEAMAAGCPVIATRINGIPELIEDGATGLLVSPGRADLLADAIERLVSGPRFAQRMALAARERVCRDFNVGTSAQQLHGILCQSVARNSHASERTVGWKGISASWASVPLAESFGTQAQRAHS